MSRPPPSQRPPQRAPEPHDVVDVIGARRSVRSYLRRAVPEETLAKILEAVRRAPSAGNLQAFMVYQVTGHRALKRLAHAAQDQTFIADAPVALVFCADPLHSARHYGVRGERLYALQDATIACAYAQLAAASMGLGAVWIGAFSESEVASVIDADEGHVPIAILPIGFPAEAGEPTSRRPLGALMRRTGDDD
jgi:nitroreductase